jgi:hypothetical protein
MSAFWAAFGPETGPEAAQIGKWIGGRPERESGMLARINVRDVLKHQFIREHGSDESTGGAP